MTRAVVLLCALFCFSEPAAAQRLSGQVVPDHYALWFAPDLTNATFRGRATIDVTLAAASREIMLHAAELTFGEVTVTAAGRTQPARVTLDPARDTATLLVPIEMPAGKASIQIAYTGILNDKLRGFYLGKANGRNYALSQLEATDARRAFPSFDEPAFKATFDVALMIDRGDVAISNGAQISDVPGPEPGKHTVTFARTPKMSSYLVAMIVGDFVCREGSADAIPVRVCSTPDKRALTGFALDAAVQQLKFYNQYFGVKYPYGKLDLIGVPDFSAGAMENTGAITFRESVLLADPDHASVGTRKNVASVVAHEIAHQWFGDLVTMKWWDDIWLNEGFATWMANKPLAAWRPEWHMELDETQETLTAKATDALRSTRPVRTDVESPDQINQVFDAIAYQKGASVLRMIEAYVGPESFQKGVSSYVKKYSYGNATAEDFWNEIARVTGKPVDRIMQTFIDQPGIPVVSPQVSCNAGRSSVSVQQERFVSDPGATAPRASQVWNLPVCMRPSAGGAPRCELVTRASQTIPDGAGCSATPHVLNADGRGYYFTENPPDTARALARSASTALTPSERLGLLDDEWWMARAGRHDIGVFLDVSAALAHDETPTIADLIRTRLAYVADYIVPPAQRTQFEQWVRDRFAPALSSADVFGASRDDNQLIRGASLLSLVGVQGNSPDVQRRARELADAYMKNPSSVAGAIAPTVLHLAALNGDTALYERYLAELNKPGLDPEAYYRYLYSLTWFRDPALVSRTLEFAVSPGVRSQDTGQLIGAVLAQPWGQEIAWQFIQQQWGALSQRLGVFQGIPGVIRGLDNFCSAERAADIRQFFVRNPIRSSDRLTRQVVERIESCAAVQARQAPAFAAWLSSMASAPN